ncbi:hypothetical protein TRICI_002936 [Trichomonascus ciferrii]|uniref:Uncharacterized protein n=1 Tax=Trichomonascus ciferrii TaxID=44093 RepID=A0A642V5E2_9ASCO|nr:hypothetical protein TRICI_002936 [Trichomonascus ciferrii]
MPSLEIPNKRRPRKVRPPYRRYGPGSARSPQQQQGGQDEEATAEAEVEQDVIEVSTKLEKLDLVEAQGYDDKFNCDVAIDEEEEDDEEVDKRRRRHQPTKRRHTTTGIISTRGKPKSRRRKQSLGCFPISSDEEEDKQKYDDLGNPINEKEEDYSSDSIDMEELNRIEREYLEIKRKKEMERLTIERIKQQEAEKHKKRSPFLPPEILAIIFDYLPQPRDTNILYVSRTWYSVGIEFIYQEPTLNVYNYAKFVDTISHSNVLGGLVKVLDLRNIIQSGKNSFTSRLLRRCSSSLRTFIAPQTSFGYAPLVSLKQCTELRNLDLSLVSETVDLSGLFAAINNARKLERLDFPRSSVCCHKYEDVWPESLWYIGLSGGISNEFLEEVAMPKTISQISLNHCPFINTESTRRLLAKLGPTLTNVRVLYPMPGLRPDALDSIFFLCPNLRSMTASVDYLSRRIFANIPSTNSQGEPTNHPLKYLTLDSSGMMGLNHKIEADDISLAILDNKLPNLSHVRISVKLRWNAESEDMCELVEILSDRNGGVWLT